MRSGGLVLLLSACSAAPALNDEQPVSRFVTLQSEDAVGGVRPELSLSCGAGDPFLMLTLVRAPESPQVPAEAFASFKIDDAAPERLKMVSVGGDRWTMADDAVEASLIRRLLAGRSLYVLGPEGTTERAYRWDSARLGPHLETLRRACG